MRVLVLVLCLLVGVAQAADITNPQAVTFSNEHVRTNADLLSQSYYKCVAAIDRWNGLGGDDAAIAVMLADLRATADSLLAAYTKAFLSEKLWFLLGGTSLIPNTSDPLIDGAPSDGRPAITGAQAVTIIDRVVQVQNWLFSATQSFTDTARNNASAYNTVLAVSSHISAVPSVADAGNLINRCTELRTNYQANNSQNLNFLLAVAVHPGS